MKKTNKVICKLILAAFCCLVVFDMAWTVVKAKNSNYDFIFDFLNDYSESDTRTKDGNGNQAYVNCTYADSEGEICQVWMMTLDSDGNYNRVASGTEYLQIGDELYLNNDAQIMETTWLRAKLVGSWVVGEGEGSIMSGRWRPDADVIGSN